VLQRPRRDETFRPRVGAVNAARAYARSARKRESNYGSFHSFSIKCAGFSCLLRSACFSFLLYKHAPGAASPYLAICSCLPCSRVAVTNKENQSREREKKRKEIALATVVPPPPISWPPLHYPWSPRAALSQPRRGWRSSSRRVLSVLSLTPLRRSGSRRRRGSMC
jgi:hypothetical protein